jgi:hypothetical protein
MVRTPATWCFIRLLEGAGAGAALGYAIAAGVGFGLHYTSSSCRWRTPIRALRCLDAPRETPHLDRKRGDPDGRRDRRLMPLFIGDVRGQREQDRGQEFSLLALPYTAQTFVGGFAIGPAVWLMHPAVRAGRTPGALGLDTLSSAVAILVAGSLFSWRSPRRAPEAVVPGGGDRIADPRPVHELAPGVGYRPRYAPVALPYALLWLAGGIERAGAGWPAFCWQPSWRSALAGWRAATPDAPARGQPRGGRPSHGAAAATPS